MRVCVSIIRKIKFPCSLPSRPSLFPSSFLLQAQSFGRPFVRAGRRRGSLLIRFRPHRACEGELRACDSCSCGRRRRTNNILGMVADTESSDSLPGTSSSNAAVEAPADGSLHQRSLEKTPKKTHKAEREKLKRDQLNDLFVELSSMLDLDRQNAGKASVLGDAARALRDLITQVESLRKEQSALVSERRYVSSEKNELQEENTTLKTRISELQNEICARMGISSLGMTNPMADAACPDLATHPTPHQMWNNIPSLSSVAMTHSANTASPFHSQHHSSNAGQGHAPQPQELQLFPGPSSSPDCECPRLRSDQDTSSSLTDSLPGQLCLCLPQSSQEGSSNGVSRSRKEQ